MGDVSALLIFALLAGIWSSVYSNVSNQKQTYIVEAGSALRLECGIPSNVSTSWNIPPGIRHPNTQILGRQLKVNGVLTQQAGRYSCLQNGMSKHFEVTVVARPVENVTVYLTSGNLTREGKAALQCRSYLHQISEVHWQRPDGKSLSTARRVAQTMLWLERVTKDDEGLYQCVSGNGVDFSIALIHLIVSSLPPLQVHPTYIEAPHNVAVNFECRTSPLLKPRWYSGGTLLLPFREEKGLSVVRITGEQRLHCIVEDNGVQAVADALLVGSGPETHPKVNIQPPLQTLLRGERAQLMCNVENAVSKVSYTWTKAGQPLPPNAKVAGPFLYLENVQPQEAGVFVCTAENVIGKGAAAAIIEVEGAVKAEVSPKTVVVRPGENVYINCHVKGRQQAKIHWSVRRRSATSTAKISSVGSQYVIRDIGIEDAGLYKCMAESTGESSSDEANISVDTRLNERYVVAEKGSTVEIRCPTPSHLIDPFVSWSKDGQALPMKAIEFGNIVRIRGADLEDQGRYNCTLMQAGATIQDYVYLRVSKHYPISASIQPSSVPQFQPSIGINPAPVPIVPTFVGPQVMQPLPSVFLATVKPHVPIVPSTTVKTSILQKIENVLTGFSVKIRPAIEVDCNFPKDASISWSKEKTPLKGVGNLLYLINAKESDKAHYICTGYSQKGKESKDIKIKPEPDKLKIESKSLVKLDISLKCEPSDNKRYDYVWTKNKHVIPITTQTYRMTNVTSAVNGDYKCYVKSGKSSVGNSSTMEVKIELPNVNSRG